MHGLVVGNNLQAATDIGQMLGADGFLFTVHVADSRGAEAPLTLSAACEAVVFDCPQANCNGHCVPRQLRANGHQLPVLVIAPRGPNWTVCLDAGADDYLAAPHEPTVLRARVRALLRRAIHNPTVGATHASPVHVPACTHCPRHSTLSVGELRLDLISRTAYRGGKAMALTGRESRLLELLMRHAGAPCSRKLIREQAWGYRGKHPTNVTDQNVRRLREKIDFGFDTRIIETVHGVGYRLSPDGWFGTGR